MKLFVVLVSLFAAAQANFFIGAPVEGDTVQAGDNVTVQVVVPVSTSADVGKEEVSLIIGIVECGPAPCPAPLENMGQNLFTGIYQSQGGINNNVDSFDNFTVVIPTNISGDASIQIKHEFQIIPPPSAPRIPAQTEYQSVVVQVQATQA